MATDNISVTDASSGVERYTPPDINFQRAAVSLDDFCRVLHDHFYGIKEALAFHDLIPDTDQLEAMLMEVMEVYIMPMYRREVTDAVGNLVAAIARPLDGWSAE